ncbi:MAG: AAA family ATPase [Pegethrix bostrychoides GSE-TBD4-15B]|jgi:putative ATPase|uniref:Replication-associated recombination protein A n=1 Tax=Pegethrix bostrychoides GSE-TBD4-15B TaxID=2839662 RepID=A0A951U5K4_9CYAN|nr:AAA family ATPase [Pegethrix bostrychoides GSE-TBD4-15B]
MTLFDQHRQHLIDTEAPLAARMRPRSLDEFIGQAAIMGQGRLLRRAIQADQLSSLIFYGPPGTGKTTLAQIIANSTQAHFISINAVLAGVKEIREAIATAQEKRGRQSQKTILFIDEVHRFNKSQQDALLPWVENGTVILIGATTENPYFEVNKALVSRSRLFQLKPLEAADLRQVIAQALQDPRGYGHKTVQIEPAAAEHLINVANGDARTLLNALELAVETTPENAEGTVEITLAVAEESIQHRAVLYDKEGDAHFDTISAFIKSIRGSDPDAALYWLARMVYAGEDPRFIFRRLLILASEDVGLADPNAVVIVNACVAAFDRVGMPEGRYPLSQATLYLATAPKSNSVMGFFDALTAVEQEREAEVPTHLRDSNRDKQGFGHGAGYLYPHSYREHWVAQQYLPSSLQGQVFYQPSSQGQERQVQQQVARQREAQLAAMLEGFGLAAPEMLTFSPADSATDRWLQRSLTQAGQRLAQLRDHLFELANLQRHHLVLDLNAGSGLLTWEALRQVPEGGVYAAVQTSADAEALREQIARLPELSRPLLLPAQAQDLPQQLAQRFPEMQFDCIMGRNALAAQPDQVALVNQWLNLLHPQGQILLAETIPQRTQRLYQLLNAETLGKQLYKRLVNAEEAIYADPTDAKVNWNLSDLEQALASHRIKLTSETIQTELTVTSAILERWFSPGQERPSYCDRLAAQLSAAELKTVREGFLRLKNQVVLWQSTVGYIQIWR